MATRFAKTVPTLAAKPGLTQQKLLSKSIVNCFLIV
jgi:hypothetical protein